MRLLAKIFSALTLSSCPKTIEMRAEAPNPTSIPTAPESDIMGKVSANPEIASAPTPCPMKIRSMTL